MKCTERVNLLRQKADQQFPRAGVELGLIANGPWVI